MECCIDSRHVMETKEKFNEEVVVVAVETGRVLQGSVKKLQLNTSFSKTKS